MLSAGVFNKIFVKQNDIKSRCQSYAILQQILANEIENSKRKNFDENSFCNLISQDICYVSKRPSLNSRELLEQLNSLEKSFKDSMSSGEEVDIGKYLLALAYLEIDIYSQESGLETKLTVDCPFDKANILSRLKMIGLDSDYKKDSMLASLMETVNKITSYPFIGCEAELARLNRIAIEYTIETLEHLQPIRTWFLNLKL